MISVTHKISGSAPAVNSFKGREALIDRSFVVEAEGFITLDLAGLDPLSVPRLLAFFGGNFESTEELGLVQFKVDVVYTGVTLSSKFCPNKGEVVFPVEATVGGFALDHIRVESSSLSPGLLRALVTI